MLKVVLPRHRFPKSLRVYSPCPGAEYNLDLITAANRALAELAEINWPGVGSEDPVALGSGAGQVSLKQMWIETSSSIF